MYCNLCLCRYCFGLRVCARCATAAGTCNPIRSAPPDQNGDQNGDQTLSNLTARATSLQSFVLFCNLCSDILTKMWMGTRSRCMPYYLASANIPCMPTAKCCPFGNLSQKHARVSPVQNICCPINAKDSDTVHVHACGRNGTGHLCQDLCTCQVLALAKCMAAR
jgi:hypothetical protein